ncbi:MAG: VOC family protein, partial [Candidatus Binataceae bacterium]
LGLVRTVDYQRASDYGAKRGQLGVEFTITAETIEIKAAPSMHICFRAPHRTAVRDFHSAALMNRGADDGRPGLRPQYHPDFYAAFVLDPDGHRIEAVCHAPETPEVSSAEE